MSTFSETTLIEEYDPFDVPLQLVMAEHSGLAYKLHKRLGALADMKYPSVGQMAWFDDALSQVQAYADERGLHVSKEMYAAREHIQRRVNG